MSSIDLIVRADQELYALITKEISDQSSKKYNNDQWTLSQLDKWRSRDLPKLLKSREHAYLSKDELKLLMDWKLAKGKFRPTLPKLINSNDAASVEEITKAGIELFLDGVKALDADDWKSVECSQYQAVVKSSLKELCKLRGVGPATASLILSLICEVSSFAPPFFSDEAFMYYIRDALRPSQPIKYNVKEYVDEYVPVILGVLKNSGSPVTAQTLERGAWSLKTYQIYCIDRLADVKMPFDVDEPTLDQFSDAQELLGSTEKSKSSDKKVAKYSKALKRSLKSSKEEPSKKPKLEKSE